MDYLWLIGIPAAGGVAIYVLWLLAGWASRRAVGAVASVVAVAIALWTCGQAVAIFRSPAGVWTSEAGPALGPLTLVLSLRADGLSTLIVVAASAIALLVTLYSLRAMAGHERQAVYYAWVLWTLAAVMAAALANTFLVLIIAWEVATVLLYLLIGMGRPEGSAAGMKTFAMLGFADVCLLMGVALLLGAGVGDGRMLIAGGAGANHLATDGALGAVAYLLMVAAALAKAGAMPLHTWIPAASEDAPTPVFALLPAALDKLLGIYLLARLTFEVFQVGASLAAVLMVIGAATILLAVMMAMIQHNLKRLLAFDAISQAGYMVLGIGLAAAVLAAGRAAGGLTPAQQAVATIAFAGAIFHALNNAVYKTALFLVAGSVERVAGTMDLDRLGGLARVLPVTFVCFVVAGLAIAGVPPLNGFVSKWLIYQGAVGVGSGLALVGLVVAILGSAMTLAVFMKAVHSVFLGTRGSASPADDRPRESLAMAVPMVVLALACVGLGVGGGWAVDRLILPAARAVGIETVGIEMLSGGALELRGGAGLWDPTLATGLILLGILMGLLAYMVTRGTKIRVVPNFVGGEDSSSDARWHASGTGFYETIQRLPGLHGAFDDASAGAFDVYRLTGRYGHTLVERLRGWHTGLLATYASWIVVGLVVLVVVLVLQ